MEIEIIGVGFDSPDNNALWVEDQGYQYEVWSDTNRTLALYYGAATSTEQSYPSRITRLLDTDGSVILEYNDASFLSNPDNVLEDCLLLFAKDQ